MVPCQITSENKAKTTFAAPAPSSHPYVDGPSVVFFLVYSSCCRQSLVLERGNSDPIMSKRQTTSSAPPSSSKRTTRLDRNLTIILPKDRWEDTASRRDGIPASVERLHRLHGTSLIFEASTKDLELFSPSTTATACCLFHRFYHHPSSSLSNFDVWSVAMASLLLATKIDDGETKSGHIATMKDIINAFARIYARRLVFADVEVHDNSIQTLQTIQQSQYSSFLEEPILTWAKSEQRQKVCNEDLPQKLYRSGTVYETWHRQITETESIILHRLGYTVYWIPESHPYKFLLRFCEVLQIPSTSTSTSTSSLEKEEDSPKTTTNNVNNGTTDSSSNDDVFVQTAWKYCNDSYRLDLSVRYPAEVIALSAMLLASIESDIQLPMKPIPWFEVFLGKRKDQFQDVVDVSNSILGIRRGNGSSSNENGGDTNSSSSSVDINDFVVEWDVATKGFMKSLSPSKPRSNNKNNNDDDDEEEGGPAFLDPNSFLWDHQRSLFITQIEKTGETS